MDHGPERAEGTTQTVRSLPRARRNAGDHRRPARNAPRPANEVSTNGHPMTDATEPTRFAFEHPDEAGCSDEKDPLSHDQLVLIDEETADPRASAVDFAVVNDERTSIYEATVGHRKIAGLPYKVVGDRLVLLATSVFPEFRKRGVATELIRRVLDDVRARGKTITVMCPIVHTFVEHNPEYADLIDPTHPGVTKGHR
jgi:predicted GNAT family acetyltransferase